MDGVSMPIVDVVFGVFVDITVLFHHIVEIAIARSSETPYTA